MMTSSTWRSVTRTLLTVAVLLPLATGCPKKAGSGTDGFDSANGTSGGFDENSPGAAGSSLSRSSRGQRPEEDGLLKDVHFGYDSDELDGAAQATVSNNAGWLREHPNAKVELEGHCDNRGTPEYNLALGSRRASAVKQALIAAGVASTRISTISYGLELPLCQEESDACWARNRRVHGVVLGK